MARTRRINGKTWASSVSFSKKSEANQRASQIRQRGGKARVFIHKAHTGKTFYDVYTPTSGGHPTYWW